MTEFMPPGTRCVDLPSPVAMKRISPLPSAAVSNAPGPGVVSWIGQ